MILALSKEVRTRIRSKIFLKARSLTSFLGCGIKLIEKGLPDFEKSERAIILIVVVNAMKLEYSATTNSLVVKVDTSITCLILHAKGMVIPLKQRSSF